MFGSVLHKRKTMYIKIKDKDQSIKSTRQMKIQADTTQRKNESKQSTKNKEKKSYANKTLSYKMTINDNKKDLR
jgi:hypothetical protein